MRMLMLVLLIAGTCAYPTQEKPETDGPSSRKVLGSSVVTSVSVILDAGAETHFSDAVGKPVLRPAMGSQVASPINLLNPDRYEFYTFNDNGELVKRLMTLEEIQGIIANGDGDSLNFNSQSFYLPEKKVNDVVNNVQNVLKEEMESHKNSSNSNPILDTPDVSSSWSMILPAIFGNSGEQIKPDRPQAAVTADTIMIDDQTIIPPIVQKPMPFTNKTPINFTEIKLTHTKPAATKIPETTIKYKETEITTDKETEMSLPTTTQKLVEINTTPYLPTLTTTENIDTPVITVAIITRPEINTTINIENVSSNKATTKKPIHLSTKKPTQIFKPVLEATKDIVPNTFINKKPIIKPSTYRPLTHKFSQSTRKPILSSTTASTTTTSTTTQTPSTTTTTSTTTQTPSTTKSTTTARPSPTTTTTKPTTLINTTPRVTSFTKVETIAPASQFIQIFDPTTYRPIHVTSTTPNIHEIIHKIEKPNLQSQPIVSNSLNSPDFLSTVFIFDQKTNTKIPITTKEQLTTLLNSLPHESTTELLRPSSINNYVQSVTTDNKENKFTSTEHEYVATTSNIKEIQTAPIQALITSSTEGMNYAEITNVQGSTANINKATENYSTMKEALTHTTDLTNVPYTTEIDKLSIPEILDQLLLTSTNIYEINTELGEKGITQNLQQTTYNVPEIQTTENIAITYTTDKIPDISVTQKLPEITTNIRETTSYSENTQSTNVDNTELPSTTAPNLINSIEQLLQQAVGNIGEVINDTKDRDKIGEIISSINDKPMTDLQAETATAASNLLDNINQDDDNIVHDFSNVENNAESITNDNDSLNDDLINEAVGSLLSQVVSSAQQGLTTLKEIPSTTEQLHRTETDNIEIRHKTTDILSETTEGINLSTIDGNTESADRYAEIDITDKISTIENTEVQTPENFESTTASFENNIAIINNTFVEISLQSVIDELSKNITNAEEHTEQNNEILNTDASSYVEKEIYGGITEREQTATQQQESEITTQNVDLEKITQKHEYEPNTNTIDIIESTTLRDVTTSYEELTEKLEITEPTLKNIVPVELTTESINTIQYEEQTTMTALTNPTTVNYENKETITKKISILKPDVKKDDSEHINNTNWSLVSTIAPHSNVSIPPVNKKPQINIQIPKPVDLVPQPLQGFGLEDSTSKLDTDIYQFVGLCNELAFGFWSSVTTGISAARSVFVSPFAATSLLAMVFLGARGATSGEMNEILKLDDMVTFNPHLIFRNVTESIGINKKSGIATSVILRELYSDRGKGELLNFYKERARQFYDGHVEEVSFKEVGDVIKRRTNMIIKRQTSGKITEYIKDSAISVKPPLAGVSISIFQTDCSDASTEGRDGELYFVVLPSIRQRRLIPVPAVIWRSGFLAGYEPTLDATAVALGNKDKAISTIFVIPGQQGIAAPGDGLARLERHLIHSAFKDGAWSRILRSLIPRPGLEVQIPRFSHRSVINATVALQQMGMRDLFDSDKADLRGLNGVANDLYLSDILQINQFATCGENTISDTHHSEIYPATANRTVRRSRKFKDVLQPDEAYYDSELLEEPRDYQRAFHDPLHDPKLFSLPLPLRPRQARLPDAPRLRFDRPFLYFVRHNPTGLILHMGRFNPRLLP